MRLKLSFLNNTLFFLFFLFLIFALKPVYSFFFIFNFLLSLLNNFILTLNLVNFSTFLAYDETPLFLYNLDYHSDGRQFWNFVSNVPRNTASFFSIKFLLCIALLIFIRGGTPRYRYDYLTKIGWVKFLGFTLLVFFFVLFLFFII